MSERPLPPNINDWPTNPYLLLDIEHPFSNKDLKRAYNRLIRYYKPELFPAEFARIREAYDRLLPWADKSIRVELPPIEQIPLQEKPDVTKFESSETQDVTKFESSETQEELPEPEFILPPPKLVLVPQREDGDAHWNRATQGQFESAYRGLVEETIRSPNVSRNYLRLFWILLVHPESDLEHQPVDWLIRGLKSCQDSSMLLETYANHLKKNPSEAQPDRLLEFLDHLNDIHQLAYFVQVCWKLLLEERRFVAVDELFQPVRARLINQPEAWLTTISVMMDYLLWEKASLPAIDLTKRCQKELNDLDYLSLQRPERFDRIDFLKTLTTSVQAVSGKPGFDLIVPIVRREWNSDLEHVRRDIYSIIANFAKFPNRWSNRFDDAGEEAYPVICQLYQILGQLHLEGEQVDIQRHSELIQQRLSRKLSYPSFRDQIQAFCLETFISPESLVDLLAPHYARAFPQDTSFEEQLLGDWPLRVICLASRIFHS